jgi:molybdenum cofactor cytidylyltransferase
MDLRRALRLGSAARTAFVGAGGKTSAIAQLAHQLPSPVIVTTTTHMGIWQTSPANRHLIAQTPEELASLEEGFQGVALVTAEADGDRLRGVSEAVLDWLHQFCERNGLPLLIEADGSRQRPLKAPDAHEPPIPEFVDSVVVVAGLSGLGAPLDSQHVHRPEVFSQRGGLALGQLVTIEALAKVLCDPGSGLKNIPSGARRIALLNQADTAELQAKGHSLVQQLQSCYESVAIASLQNGNIYASYAPMAAILLAAGESRRFGEPKQLLDWRGKAFVRQVAETALTAKLSRVVVVTGAQAEPVEAAIHDLPVQIIRNTEWQSGQSSSIRAGLEALPTEIGAAIFLLVDQPQVSVELLQALIEQYTRGRPLILAPLIEDQRANPVLFDRETFPDLLALKGDIGGRGIFSKHKVTYLPWYDASLLSDIDTPEDYQRLLERLS